MGKNYMGFFYGKKYNSGNGTFSLETGEIFIEGTGLGLKVLVLIVSKPNFWKFAILKPWKPLKMNMFKYIFFDITSDVIGPYLCTLQFRH